MDTGVYASRGVPVYIPTFPGAHLQQFDLLYNKSTTNRTNGAWAWYSARLPVEGWTG